jgi:pimeloyl-ACP methyl ester carboxylesterase
VCGVGPLCNPEEITGLSRVQSMVLRYASSLLFLVPVQIWCMVFALTYTPRLYMWFTHRNKPKIDKDAFLSDEQIRAYRESFLEGVRISITGAVQDPYLYMSPWGFSLEDISKEVYLYHGLLDNNVPVAIARYVEEKIPTCKATHYPESGHYLFHSRAFDILSSFIV